MDILLENMPQMLPETPCPLTELYEYDPFDIVTAMCEPGVLHLRQACIEVMQRYMASIDDTCAESAVIGLAIARALECVTTEYCTPRNNDNSGSIVAVLQLQHCAQLLKEMLADHQTFNNSRRKYDLTRNHSTEKVERAWATLIKNKANLDEFKKGRPDIAYLEVRKIFLPQGATLILEYWQREFNAFVSELETTSEDPARVKAQKASSFKLYNMPRIDRPTSIGMFDITTHSNLPAPLSSSKTFGVQRAPISEFATVLAKSLRDGVESPNSWVQTCLCFTSVITGTERRKNLKGVLWRPPRL